MPHMVLIKAEDLKKMVKTQFFKINFESFVSSCIPLIFGIYMPTELFFTAFWTGKLWFQPICIFLSKMEYLAYYFWLRFSCFSVFSCKFSKLHGVVISNFFYHVCLNLLIWVNAGQTFKKFSLYIAK